VNALIDAVASSIVAEVPDAGTWTLEKKDPMWRNPKKGKVLNVFLGRELPGTPRWTGGTMDLVEIVVEYAEPAPENRNLTYDQEGEYAANDVARSIREWGLAHEAGFSPAHKMDWAGTDYTPLVRREFFVRYCRVTFLFEVQVTYG
jgi:hypothetical protein